MAIGKTKYKGIIVSVIICTILTFSGRAQTPFSQNCGLKIHNLKNCNIEDFRSFFNQDLQDSLQAEWWKIILACKTPDEFCDVAKKNLLSSEGTSDSISQSRDSHAFIPMIIWMKFLSIMADITYYTGIGSSICFDQNFNELDHIPIHKKYRSLYYQSINYTQCIAALTWYDLNRQNVSPELFMYYTGCISTSITGGDYLFFDIKEFPYRYLSDISEKKFKKNPDKYLSKAYERHDDMMKKAQDLMDNCYQKSVPVRPSFNLWPISTAFKFDIYNYSRLNMNFESTRKLGLTEYGEDDDEE